MTFQLQGSAPDIYERAMVPLWFGRWAEALIELSSPALGEKVLDVACGTGVTTRLAKTRVGDEGCVDGLDINAPMLAKAKDLAADLNINWIESDVCNGELPSGHYDLVISQHGYNYFPDKPAALKEFYRLLVPGGRLAFSVWAGHSPYTDALCAAIEKYISPEVAAKQRGQRETPSGAELSQSVADAGFSDANLRTQELMIRVPLAREFVPLHLGSMPIAGAFQALSDVETNRLIGDIEEAMSGYVEGDTLLYPDAVNVAVGVK